MIQMSIHAQDCQRIQHRPTADHCRHVAADVSGPMFLGSWESRALRSGVSIHRLGTRSQAWAGIPHHVAIHWSGRFDSRANHMAPSHLSAILSQRNIGCAAAVVLAAAVYSLWILVGRGAVVGGATLVR